MFNHHDERCPQDFGPIYCPTIYRRLVEQFPPRTWTGEGWAPVDTTEALKSAYGFPQLKEEGEAGLDLDEEPEPEDGEIV